jgi:hypothetical protein
MPKIKKNVINAMIDDKIVSSVEPDNEMKVKGKDMYWYPTYYEDRNHVKDKEDILESIL